MKGKALGKGVRTLFCALIVAHDGEVSVAIPVEEATHSASCGGLQHKMPMIEYKFVAEYPTRITLDPLRKNPLEGRVVFVLLKGLVARIPSIEGMINSTRFIGAIWSRDSSSLITTPGIEKSPDPFSGSLPAGAEALTIASSR